MHVYVYIYISYTYVCVQYLDTCNIWIYQPELWSMVWLPSVPIIKWASEFVTMSAPRFFPMLIESS